MNDADDGLGSSEFERLGESIDLLVEGELDATARRELIGAADRQPELWRRVALAYMERDALARSLRDLTRDSGSPRTVTVAQCVNNEANTSTRNRSLRLDRVRDLAVLGSAAIVLLTLGFAAGTFQPNHSPPRAAVATGESHSPLVAMAERESADQELWLHVSNAVNQLSVADSEVIALVHYYRDGAQSEFVPIIRSPMLADQVMKLPQPQLADGLVEKVHRAGWRLDTSRQFLSFHLPDGENRILPIDTVNYRYVGQELF